MPSAIKPSSISPAKTNDFLAKKENVVLTENLAPIVRVKLLVEFRIFALHRLLYALFLDYKKA
jgi:hypothetical protein